MGAFFQWNSFSLVMQVMYCWCIMHKPRTELVRQVLDVMLEFPTKNSWITSVKQDLKYFNIDLSETLFQ